MNVKKHVTMHMHIHIKPSREDCPTLHRRLVKPLTYPIVAGNEKGMLLRR